MSLGSTIQCKIADALDSAERERSPIEALATLYPGITEEDAYAVQNINAQRAVKNGKRLVGYKLGLTSREAQRQFNVFQPDFGHLFDSMAVLDDGVIQLSSLIQPKIEGEIAFVLGRDLKGPGVTIIDVLGAIDYATAALEIVDSRIKEWRITAEDTIADNGSSSRFVLCGVKRRIEGIDFSGLGMALYQNGEVKVTGAGAAVMGNPLAAVVFLANELSKFDRTLRAGEVILSGALSSMLTVAYGDFFSCEIASLGKVRVRFTQKGGDHGTH